jgi:hypothetical protein
MKKLPFIAGIGVGFLLGSRAGSGPYEELEHKVRSLRHRPDVEDTIARARDAASDQVSEVVEKVNDTLPTSSNSVPRSAAI